jgi:isopentenyldiphosphate isomerase
MSTEESVVIVDARNRVVGAAPRGRMRRENLIHRATYILVFNSGGELFVHRRTLTKDVYPGFYDVAAGGVVQAGESYDESARRELAEELGILDRPLEALFDTYWEDAHCRVWGRVYRCVCDGPMVLQPEEVMEGCFMRPEAVLRDLPAHRLTPDGRRVLSLFLAWKSEPAR